MFGFLIFYNIYSNLSLEGRNKFLGDIFKINNVSVTDFVIKDNRVVIRLFSYNVFYQFVFFFGVGESVVIADDRIVKGKISVFDNSCKEFNLFIYLLSRCSFEKDVYQLFRQFL